MGKSSKKSAPKVDAAPAVQPPKSTTKKGKREAEDELEKQVSAKKQKRDVVTEKKKQDEVTEKQKQAKMQKNKKESSSEDSSSSDSEEDKKPATKATFPSKTQPAKNGKVGTGLQKSKPSSSSSSSESSDDSSDDNAAKSKVVVNSKVASAAGKNGTVAAKKKVESSESSDTDSSSDDENDDRTKVAPSSKKLPVVAAKKVESDSETSDSESDSSSDEDNVTKSSKKLSAASKSTPAKKIKSSDDSTSDSSSDEDDDLKTKQPAVSKKLPASAGVSKKKVESSDSSDDESSDESSDDGKKSTVTALSKPSATPKKAESSDSSDSDSSSSDDDNKNKKTANVPKANVKAASSVKTPKQESSEGSEDDSSEDEGKMDVDEDSSSEESDEEPQKKKVKALTQKASKESSDSSEDSEEDTEIPSKTPQKNGKDVEMVDADSMKSNGKQAPKTPFTPKGQPATSKTLFVGNLSYQVERADLEYFFKDCGEVVDVRLATDENGTFKGFGHIEFATAEAAQNAMEMNGKELLNRSVRLDFARERGAYTPNSGNFSNSFQKGGEAQAHTIFVKGLDTSQGVDEIRTSLEEHFSCGEISRISVPKDFDTGAVKGYAYLDFKDVGSFNKALELNGSELGGYSLIVDEARPRSDFQGSSGGRGGGRSGGRGGRDGGGRFGGGRFGGRHGGGRGGRGGGRGGGGRGRGTPYKPSFAAEGTGGPRMRIEGSDVSESSKGACPVPHRSSRHHVVMEDDDASVQIRERIISKRGDDMDQNVNHGDDLHVPTRPITRARSKRIQQAM
ncbi:nucleolin 2 isoform X2 [Senna tora]|uniref:Nucleolin 2 isoform X2 n=1 Tax=Senna tora TaxID=362788 RepID=A0A834WPZ8_9FABA|nr:nucleolin 2 isoform X2 [Senna tora]